MALCLLLFGCVDSDSRQATLVGMQLEGLYRAWVRDGRPDSVDTSRYITSSSSLYFVHTNIIKLGTNQFHSRFAARSSNFRRQGILVITDEQILLWVSDDGKVIVSPQRNARFDR